VVTNQEALKHVGIKPVRGDFARASTRWFMSHVKQINRLKGLGGIERVEKWETNMSTFSGLATPTERVNVPRAGGDEPTWTNG
jgi:hypothetical protein